MRKQIRLMEKQQARIYNQNCVYENITKAKIDIDRDLSGVEMDDDSNKKQIWITNF